ncbi:DUF2726 domain-containing protein [Solimicrobium silvestre]|uniref:DUF2726 domain-containing protein n=1 Tax=Solimicrobium silvestre TaxID=2099400 RepID=A0A2S9GSP2_9BURK|nr:DUF2726 domain-containing protein [Solimicrobium silvestre]PRC90716.1 hypothetical protein S2091_4542 [Solimicrobium silvestre]
MINPLVIAVGVIIIGGILTLAASKKTGKNKTYSYKAKKLFTNNEKEMHSKLTKTFPEYKIFSQVALSSMIEGKNFASHGTISRMSVDFVILDQELNIVSAIEIDDKSHQREDRKKADATKNEAFKQAGIKLIRWPAVPHPNEIQMLKDVKG